MADSMRFGLIGCGSHGLGNLTPALKHTGVADLVACADADEVAAHGAVQEHGFGRPYLDYQEMLSRESLDGVVVATPHHLLKDAVIAAVRSGCNVLVEKPVGLNRGEAVEVQKAAHQAGVTVMVAYCMRYSEGRRIMKDLLERGAVGDIIQVTGGKTSAQLQAWRDRKESGGGPMFWIGSHLTDQVLWMVDDEVERVYAEITRHPETGVDQSTAYTIRFKNGVSAGLICAQGVGGRMDFVDVIGTAGRVRADWPSRVVTVQSQALPEYEHATTMAPSGVGNAEMYQDEMKAWTDSLAARREPPITIEDGIRALEVLDAVFESDRTGQAVRIGTG